MRGINRARMAKSVNGQLGNPSFVEASSLPLTELLIRYSSLQKTDKWDVQFPVDKLNEYIKSNIPNILYSTGLYITANRRDQDKIGKNIENGKMLTHIKRDIDKLNNSKIWDNVPVMLDSAGHQIYMNYLESQNVIPWINHYYKEYVQIEGVDLAFSLDIHMDYPIIKDPKEIWEYNKISVEEMYKHDISKIVWVVQFRGALLELWNKLHRKYKIFDNMNKFAIGGVAKLSKTGIINFPLFFPAACNILKGIKDAGTWSDYYLLHILGVMASTDFIQFALIIKIAQKYHNIPLHLTFDSAKMFRGQSASASMEYSINGKHLKISFRSKDLDKRVKGMEQFTNAQLLKLIVRKFDETYGFAPCHEEDIYLENDKGDMVLNKKFWIRIIQLSYINLGNSLAEVNLIADQLLDLYEKRDKVAFDHVVEKHLINFNKGSATRNILGKCENMFEGVDMLVNLDSETSNAINKRIFPSHKIFSYGNQDYLNEDETWVPEDIHESVRKV